MVTRKGRDVDGLEANAEVGANGVRGGTLQYGAVFNPNSDLAIQASWGAQDGEDIYYPELDLAPLNGGVAEGLDWEDRVSALGTFRAGGLTLQAAFSDRDKGVPTAAWRTVFNHPEASSHDRQYFTEATLEHTLASNADLTVRGGFDGFDNVGHWPFRASTDSTPEVAADTRVEVRSARGEARLAWEPGPSQRVVFGVEGVSVFRASLAISGEGADPDVGGRHPYHLLSGFVHQEFQITDRLALTLGIRRDQYSTIGGATTPRAALVFHGGASEATTLKLLLGEAFRAPNLIEMYTTSMGTALVGNPDLSPEKVRTVEAVWEQRFGRVAGTFSLFRNDVNDLIDLVQVDIPATESQGGRVAFQQQNIAAARAQGVEVELRGVLFGGVRATLGYAFTDATDARTGDRLVNSPRHTFRASATASVLERLDVGVSTRAEGRRSSLYGTQTDPVAVTDLTLATPLSDRFTVQASLRNVFDRNYSVPGGFQHVQSVIPQPHRFLNLRLAYGW
jgi:iron complex outermembrane receptor protein